MGYSMCFLLHRWTERDVRKMFSIKPEGRSHHVLPPRPKHTPSPTLRAWISQSSLPLSMEKAVSGQPVGQYACQHLCHSQEASLAHSMLCWSGEQAWGSPPPLPCHPAWPREERPPCFIAIGYCNTEGGFVVNGFHYSFSCFSHALLSLQERRHSCSQLWTSPWGHWLLPLRH